MTNTTHYPSLELYKKLTEIGFPETEILHNTNGIGMDYKPEVYPSVMEMLDVISGTEYEMKVNEKRVFIALRTNSGIRSNKFESSLPNALASMILWLYENNYISFTK